MNTYAEVGSSFQQMGGECPDGWVEMLGPRPDDENSLDYTAQPDGTWAISEETLRAKQAEVESVWRKPSTSTSSGPANRVPGRARRRSRTAPCQ